MLFIFQQPLFNAALLRFRLLLTFQDLSFVSIVKAIFKLSRIFFL